MQPFRYHVFVCDQRKPDGLPCCAARGSPAVIEALRREIAAQDLLGVVQVTACGSLGLCERGPNLVVYPDGIWYSGVGAADVPEIVREHFQNGRPVERLLNHDEAAVNREITESRNRMAAALKAREAAGVLPDELMGMIRGFQESRILLSAIELDVFTAVERRASQATATSVAAELQTDSRATGMLLNALVALGLLTKQANTFVNAPMVRKFLVAGAPDDARLALRHNLSLWATWSTLTQCVREGHVIRHQEMQERGDDWTAPFIAAMHRNAALRAPLMVRAVGAEGVKRLLDVGGGSGAYAIAFARANPALHAEVFDLAPVVPIAQKHIAEAGLGDRVGTRVGDLRQDALGSGYDLVLLSAICHMLAAHENRDLMRRAFQALAPGGRLVIQDHIMTADKTGPRAGALFAINMLVGTTGGGTYSEDEYAQWLREVGFAQVRLIALPGPNDLVVAQRA
jgi:(2Fe-2S) ferredoxin/2-polyprenyl-3-methyl-5-hydroxy-6-metoxy-1,4-benzoquinol methylase